jgi:hypothetical protein
MDRVQNNGYRPGGVTGRGFQPGRSGNPGGRPRGLARATREIVGDDGRAIAEFWLTTMTDTSAKLTERLEASRLLADRGWGKASTAELSDDDAGHDALMSLEEIDRHIARLSAELADRPGAGSRDAITNQATDATVKPPPRG